MPTPFTRRQFLRTGLVAGTALGLNIPAITRAQDATPTGDTAMPLELTGSIRRIHDPVIIKANDRYYLFCTGRGISVRQSPDLIDWEIPFPQSVFGSPPAWAQEKIPGQNDIWAPDISYFNEKYHLYYSVSTFGSNRSVIGLTTNTTLDFEDEAFAWVDQGLVVESTGAENYNCIDPNLIIDQDGVPWLAFGSFWSGIKMRRIDASTGLPSEEDTTLYSLASRSVNSGSIEAPFIIFREGFYYLFVSFDFCCRGIDSTYHVMVGRSESVTGPYVDRDGVEMLEGGGTQVTFPTERWRGPGHNAILREGDVDYIVYHAYDADPIAQGTPTLHIAPLTWDDEGWPSISTS
jgi:arabinan endo-1,5-alpha-L-arabinosidase